MEQKLLSICIPTYNRPTQLKRVLESIDTQKYNDVDIVISENCSPKQAETRQVVEEFRKNSKYEIFYYENEKNLGYDKNIRALIKRSNGKFSMFFSDDDAFMPNALDDFIEFVRNHQDVGYILRSYRVYFENGSYQNFRYYSNDRVFPAGKDTYIALFDKSVFLSGFTIRTEYARQFVTDALDGSLLYQLYLLAEVCYRYPAAYCSIIISRQIPEELVHYFGECEEEKDFYKGKTMTGTNNINFLRWYMKLVDYVGELHNDDSASIIKHNMSKYSYPLLSYEMRTNGKGESFKLYCEELKKMGLTSSKYYSLYKYALLLFGPKMCDWGVDFLKKIIGHRPQL